MMRQWNGARNTPALYGPKTGWLQSQGRLFDAPTEVNHFYLQ